MNKIEQWDNLTKFRDAQEQAVINIGDVRHFLSRIAELERQLDDANRFLANETLTKRVAELEAEVAALRAKPVRADLCPSFCPTCDCAAYQPCEEGTIGAVRDDGGEWIVCQVCYWKQQWEALKADKQRLEQIIANQRADLRAQQNGQGWDLYNQLVKAICGDDPHAQPHNTIHALKADAARLEYCFDNTMIENYDHSRGQSVYIFDRETLDALIKESEGA